MAKNESEDIPAWGGKYDASQAASMRKVFEPAEDTIERVVQLYIDTKRINEIFANRVKREELK